MPANRLTNTVSGITLLNNLPLLILGIVAASSLPRSVGNIFKALCMRKDSNALAKRAYVIGTGIINIVLLVVSVISLVGSSYNAFLYFRF